MSTVKIGILGSDLEADEALMEEISDGEEAEERNMAYGGIAWESEEEEHSLLRGFPLMLHAARIGDMAMFDSAIREMRAKHSQQQVTPETIPHGSYLSTAFPDRHHTRHAWLYKLRDKAPKVIHVNDSKYREKGMAAVPFNR